MVSFIYILLLLAVVCTTAVPSEDSTCGPGSACDGDSAEEDSALLQLRGKDSSADKEELHEKDSSADKEEVLAWAPVARAATAVGAATAHAKVAASVVVAPGTALVVTVHPTTIAAAHPRAPARAATVAAAAMALARVVATVAVDTRMAPNAPAAHLITTIAAAARPRAPARAATAAAAAMALARVA
eukprot:CAMPEP_0177377302 /NCGR_PEP_ID=MMETSP0368-20130122/45698_1 /TAXON_ID=447022 ORGANISM="Scrippsiella hangoei-like, Strain SHHI-4" /NCGR_SAMPLE_ID=MMETSP0368 /ASSEMBLY_ACC=CAM_ASM_000363 /LENGTH=186 /DNA_ID=CAMNT_0018841115 /DNA_START=60 /DNA_END=618 /DNA_ORIENTATION=+